MRVYKEKQYLIFDYEDGRTVKYDFATKQAIGIKGKPVKKLQSQLSGMTMDELFACCDDKNYAKFLKFIQKAYYYPVTNIGTILSLVPYYSRFEQFFSAGFEDIIDRHSFTMTINDIPKSLTKIAKDNEIRISDRICKYWKEDIDSHMIGYNLEYTSLNSKDIYNIWSTDKYCGHGDLTRFSIFNSLINEYGYNAKSLFLYIDKLKTFEAIDNIPYLMGELYDYVCMMSAISPKFDRYPRNFLTTHRIACRNYNRLKKQFSEEMFKARINKDYEYKFKDYCFIYPSTIQDIKDEAVSQNNCVASYIDRVIDGDCHILFLRKKDTPDQSLVTIEVRNNTIVQAARRFNEPVTDEELEAINAWNRRYSNKVINVA